MKPQWDYWSLYSHEGGRLLDWAASFSEWHVDQLDTFGWMRPLETGAWVNDLIYLRLLLALFGGQRRPVTTVLTYCWRELPSL